MNLDYSTVHDASLVFHLYFKEVPKVYTDPRIRVILEGYFTELKLSIDSPCEGTLELKLSRNLQEHMLVLLLTTP